MADDPGESASKSDFVASVKLRSKVALRWLLRAAVLSGALLTVWIIVGSIWFPGWWYAALFDAGLLNLSFLFGQGFIEGGFAYLFDDQPLLMLGLAGFCLASVFAAVYFPSRRAQFIRFLDRWTVLIVATCAFLLFADSVILYKKDGGPDASFWKNSIERSEHPQGARPQDKIDPPVDFHYLDNDRVVQDYSQIEPDLIEERRTLSTEKRSGQTVGVDAGGATLKAEASKTGQETSEFQRTESSVARKCIELMNFTLQKGSAHSYTTRAEFYTRPGILPLLPILEDPSTSPAVKELIKGDMIDKEKNLLRLSPWLTQTVKTMFAVRCEILDRQDHFSAF